MAQPDDETCDYPFSIRIPRSLAQDINRRAAAEGMKASAWARKALEFSLYQMGSDERRISSAGLIELIKYDPDVKAALRDYYNELMTRELVLCDEDGNPVELEDKTISPLKRLKSRFHPEEEPLEFPDHIDTIHHIELREIPSNSAIDDSRKRKSSKRKNDAIKLDGRNHNLC
ncbi:MAG TPA: hypothetical protein O0X27_04575 [Methanocorpusculum sp.]|nr:hypothetical protein [Methanocorpusculum sp.]